MTLSQILFPCEKRGRRRIKRKGIKDLHSNLSHLVWVLLPGGSAGQEERNWVVSHQNPCPEQGRERGIGNQGKEIFSCHRTNRMGPLFLIVL